MRKELKRGVALAAVFVMVGCVPSLHPIYNDADCVFNPALAGLWQQEDGKGLWAFTQKDARSYNLVYTDNDGIAGNFVAHLVEIQGITFMDIFPTDADPRLKINDMYALQLLPSHFFARVGDIGPKLQLAFTNPDWTQKFLAANPAALKHEVVRYPNGEERLVLTAPTAELQKFWVEHARTPEAFGEPMQLKRLPQPAAQQEQPKDAGK